MSRANRSDVPKKEIADSHRIAQTEIISLDARFKDGRITSFATV